MERGVTLDEPAAYFARLDQFEATHWWSRGLWRIADHWLDRRLVVRAGLDALDVGCGAGATLARLAARPEIGRVVGIDPSPEAIARARGRGGDAVVASALALPFGPDRFDVLTCLDVIQHLPPGGAARAFGEMARVLRAGGVAVVRTNCGGRDGCRPREIRRLIEAAGLAVMRASRVNCAGSIAQEVRGRLAWRRHRSHPSGAGLPASRRDGRLDGIMGAIARAEAFAVGRVGVSLPFGHSAMFLAIRRPDGEVGVLKPGRMG